MHDGKISKWRSIFYVDVQTQGEIHKRIGIGTNRYPDITLEPAEALSLLAWLEQEKSKLEQMTKESSDGK